MSRNHKYFPTYLILRRLESIDPMWLGYLNWGYIISRDRGEFKSEIIKCPQNLEQLICDIFTEMINDVVSQFRQEDPDTPIIIRCYMGDDWTYKESPCVKTTRKIEAAREKGLFAKPNGKGKFTDAICKLYGWQLSPGASPGNWSVSLHSYMQSFVGGIVR